jgi:hypothetical protein
MRSPNYYRLRLAVRCLFYAGILALIYLASSRLWWQGGGYCVGDLVKCG